MNLNEIMEKDKKLYFLIKKTKESTNIDKTIIQFTSLIEKEHNKERINTWIKYWLNYNIRRY